MTSCGKMLPMEFKVHGKCGKDNTHTSEA
jgi:hypothetical protein